MQAHWMALGFGLVVGAGLGWFMGSKARGGNTMGITGGFAAPFQAKVQGR